MWLRIIHVEIYVLRMVKRYTEKEVLIMMNEYLERIEKSGYKFQLTNKHISVWKNGPMDSKRFHGDSYEQMVKKAYDHVTGSANG